ncbi:MAG: protein-methionine-sulfoxide reductase catalytic subunit MsrP [Verrucomicrobiales bacterium]|nr:protein-methionine-sulfoxide reductase catalytic subunit MsrP [Verrucomicrobiales bacterium]
MANIIVRPDWFVAERYVTPESAFRNRRHFLRQVGVAGAGLLSAPLIGCGKEGDPAVSSPKPTGDPAASASVSKYPAKRNPDFSPDWKLTKEEAAATLNNFYEFFPNRATDVRKLTSKFITSPWPVQITGLVEKPMTLDVEEIVRMMSLEERVYRFRCVEAWAMIVPWTGFPLSQLIEKVSPKPEAKFLRFETFNRPDQAPGMARTANSYPWPYFEGLRMDEAMHPLTMGVTGIYGKPLPKQHGAPIRIVVPWKYGYKSIKSIVKIEFTDKQPKTFWEALQPEEYPFESNVNPAVPHPRWSQATERLIDSGDRVKTLPYNGYGDSVAKLYAKK